MTPDDLAAIRARAARFTLPDRRALLAALDEANAECAQARAEVDRLTAANGEMFGDNLALGDALSAAPHLERARIRAAVEGLPLVDVEDEDETGNGVTRLYLNVRDVLAAIDGTSTEGRSPTAESRRWEEE